MVAVPGKPQPPAVRRIGALQLTAIAVAGTATLAISVLPQFSFGYRSAEIQIALETAATIIAALAAFLLYQRFRRTRGRAELLLMLALVLMSLANAAVVVAAAGSETGELRREAVWAPTWSHLAASALLAAAAFAPQRTLPRGGGATRIVLLGMAAFVAGLFAAIVIGSAVPTGIDPELSPASSDNPRVVGAAGLLACELGAMVLLAAAGVGFTVRARATGDELLAWLALASTLGAFSRLNYFLFPSGYSDWVFTGDGLRLAAYLLILVGVLRQIGFFARAAAQTAILEERQRMARDLHDGLAQELSLIAMEARRMPGSPPEAQSIVDVSQRALADSRTAILELDSPPDEPFSVLLRRAGEALAESRRVHIHLELDPAVEVPSEIERSLLFILSEAISNAVLHGGASEIRIGLRDENWVVFSISDDGRGFEPDQAAAVGGLTGHGIENMRERARRIGGELRIASAGEQGTRIEVRLD
jgi:signal transduction histidine kinase